MNAQDKIPYMLYRVNIWHLFVKAIIKYYYKHQLKKSQK